ncbi:hypothetical protein B7463_g6930, partial [Scytalidium lignicola]
MGRPAKTGKDAFDAVLGLTEEYHRRMKERNFQVTSSSTSFLVSMSTEYIMLIIWSIFRGLCLFDDQGFEKSLMDNLKLVTVEPDGTVVFSLFLGPEYHHVGGSLHGAAAALILGEQISSPRVRDILTYFTDQCTSLSISPHSAPGYWEWVGGVSRAFSVSCLRAAPANTTVHVRCKVVSIGNTAVLVRGEITSSDEKVIYNVIDHNKLNVRLQPKKANL